MKRSMVTTAALIAAGALVASALTACGGGGGSAMTSPAPQAVDSFTQTVQSVTALSETATPLPTEGIVVVDVETGLPVGV